MKRESLKIAVFLFALVLVAGGNALAQRGYGAGRGYNGCMNLPGLTEKQMTEITKLRQQHRKEMDEMRMEWRQSEAFAQHEKHLAEVDKKVVNHRNEVRNLLTEEQKAVFDNPGRGNGRNRAAMAGRGMGRYGGGRAGWCRGGRFGRGW